jgi:hypothetical protein
MLRRLHATPPARVADGVWLVRGGLPIKTMNVYLLEERAAASASTTPAPPTWPTRSRRSAAPWVGSPASCSARPRGPPRRGAGPAGARVLPSGDRADAEGDGGDHYFDLAKLTFPFNHTLRVLLDRWDGGPVEIDGTVEEGDEVAAGFKVVHLPATLPG